MGLMSRVVRALDLLVGGTGFAPGYSAKVIDYDKFGELDRFQRIALLHDGETVGCSRYTAIYGMASETRRLGRESWDRYFSRLDGQAPPVKPAPKGAAAPEPASIEDAPASASPPVYPFSHETPWGTR